MGKIKVLYIAGPSRSGSTFLSSVLGEIPGIFNAGEVIDVWDKGFLRDGLCGCGLSFRQCEIWADVMDEFFDKANISSVQEMVRSRDLSARSWRIPFYLTLSGMRTKLAKQLQPFLHNLAELYRGIKVRTGCRVVLDSSKNVGYAFLLSLIQDIDLYCLHLVRDPRATAYSWRRKKAGLGRRSSGKSTLSWISRNFAAGLINNHMMNGIIRLRYEDFVESPKSTVEKLLCAIDERSERLPFVTESEVELSRHHSVYGNPGRFETGRFRVELDDEWRRKIRIMDYLIVSSITWPFLVAYGYPILSRD